QLFTGESSPVDPILADATAGHHNQVTRRNLLRMARFTMQLTGQRTHRTTVDQRLAQIAVIEVLPAIAIRDTTLIATLNHPVMHTIANAPRMEQPGRHLLTRRKGRTQAIAPDIDQQVGTLARTHRVTVDPNDSGHRTTIGIQRRRT